MGTEMNENLFRCERAKNWNFYGIVDRCLVIRPSAEYPLFPNHFESCLNRVIDADNVRVCVCEIVT